MSIDLTDKPLFSDISAGTFIQVSKGFCQRCKLPIYYPPNLETKIICCPYCRCEFK